MRGRARIILPVVGILLFIACSGQTTPSAESTPDIEATVSARVEATVRAVIALRPSPTPPPRSTATPTATPTILPTIEPTPAPVPTMEPTPTPTLVPTATTTPSPTATPLIRDVVARAKSAVVRIETPKSQGSGVIIDPDGLILTANHVVQEVERVDVILAGGRILRGLVKGRFFAGDIALITVNETGLPFIPIGDSDDSAAGDTLIKLGYSLGLPDEPTATTGIVSAARTNQRLDVRYLQTDAAINPGDSGGPLLNSSGEVVGISSSKLVGENIDQVGYALAINEVRDRINILSFGANICPPPPTVFSGTRQVTDRFAFSVIVPDATSWRRSIDAEGNTFIGNAGRFTGIQIYPPFSREGYATLTNLLEKGILGKQLGANIQFDGVEVQRIQPTCLPTIGDAFEVDVATTRGSEKFQERWLLFFFGSNAYFIQGFTTASLWSFNEPFIDSVIYSFRFQ